MASIVSLLLRSRSAAAGLFFDDFDFIPKKLPKLDDRCVAAGAPNPSCTGGHFELCYEFLDFEAFLPPSASFPGVFLLILILFRRIKSYSSWTSRGFRVRG